MKGLNFVPPFFFFFFVGFVVPLCSSLSSDGLSLLALKAAINSDPAQVLASWSESDSMPCRWAGIVCDDTHRVTSVSLSGNKLSGYVPSEIGALSSLTSLNLSDNNFSNLIPAHLFNATSLVSLDLSRNSFSGPLPLQITTLTTLTHLDLSSNLLNGSLPEDLFSLSHLVGALNLSYNSFSGEIPASYGRFPATLSLDLRHNNLTGKIPTEGSLLNQGPTAFTGNPYLCGFPLETQCPEPEAQNPRIFPNQEAPKDPIFSSNGVGERGKPRTGSGSGAVSLISGVSVVIGVVFVSVWAFRKKWNSVAEKPEKQNLDTSEAPKTEEGQKDKYSVLDEGFCLEIEDLLRASAYVIGKSRSGIVYKVVVGGGAATVVAVRRLSEGDSPWSFREFEAAVEAIGRVQHPNIVRLRAYYYASDEKLLITDFIHNGSLYNALHGGPGNLLVAPLSWAMRLRIAQGIARGLVHIHECSPKRYVHGNIKSSKILLDEDLKPYISGFGLTRLVPSLSGPASSGQKRMNSNQFIISPRSSNSYEAPEARAAAGSKMTQKCDVYSFGVVLLEILTGRLPDGGGGADDDGKGIECVVRKAFREERPLSEIIDPALMHEVHAKKQVVATFHIALNCTELDPELRPRMRAVADSLDRVKSQ
nr:receptor protein kinase-like protein ZAR1 [Ipomoea trifida]